MTLCEYLRVNDLTVEAFRLNLKVKVPQSTFSRYVRGLRPVPALIAVEIERATDRAVTVEALVATRKRRVKARGRS